jgi:hypothetical protein
MAQKTNPAVPPGIPGRLPNRSVDQPIVDRRSIGMAQLKQEVRDLLSGSPLPIPQVNEYLTFPHGQIIITAALSADVANYVPVVVPQAMTFDAITMSVGTGGATNVKLALYDSDGAKPTDQLTTAGPLDASTSGVKVSTFAAEQVLVSGLYFMAFLADTGTAIFNWVSNEATPTAIRHSAFTIAGTAFQKVQSYASGLPSSAGLTTSDRTGGGIPLIGIRRSA